MVENVSVQLDTHGSVDQLRAQLGLLNLDTKGNKVTLKKRLATIKRTDRKESKKLDLTEQLQVWRRQRKNTPLEYLLVIDFEATCYESSSARANQTEHEIIEFPLVLVDLKKGKILASHSSFVKPLHAPILSDFCSRLTGITQEQVNAAKEFPDVLQDIRQWLDNTCQMFIPRINHAEAEVSDTAQREEDGPQSPRFSIRNWSLATDGRSDLELFLTQQVQLSDMMYPPWSLGPYVDTRQVFASFTKQGRLPIARQLSHLGLQFEGRPHCGLDDATNIAKILLELVKRGALIHCNRYIELHKRGRILEDGCKPLSPDKPK